MGIEFGPSNVKMYIDGKEMKAESIEVSIVPPDNENKSSFNFIKDYSGTLSSFEIGGELAKELEKRRKINKMIEDRKKLEKYMD